MLKGLFSTNLYAFFEYAFYQIIAEAIKDIIQIRRIPNQKVCLFARLNRADQFRTAYGGSGIQSYCCQGFFRCHAIFVAAYVHGYLQ